MSKHFPHVIINMSLTTAIWQLLTESLFYRLSAVKKASSCAMKPFHGLLAADRIRTASGLRRVILIAVPVI